MKSSIPYRYEWCVVVQGAIYGGFESKFDAEDYAQDARETGLAAKVRKAQGVRGLPDYQAPDQRQI